MYFFVIEGQGRTIDEIDTMYLERVKPWRSSKWVPPSPEEMAEIRCKGGADIAAVAADMDQRPSDEEPLQDGGRVHKREESGQNSNGSASHQESV